MEIFIPASIRKDQIVPLSKLIGHTNSTALVLGDTTAKVGGVVYGGFFITGKNAVTKLWDGRFSFSDDVPKDAPRSDLNALFETKKTAKNKAKEVSDGIDVIR